MVALHGIRGNGEYKPFVQNRVEKTQAQSEIVWRYVSSEDNPADLASHGASVSGSKLWWNGPKWLTNREEWPSNPLTSASQESEVEAKVIREILSIV